MPWNSWQTQNELNGVFGLLVHFALFLYFLSYWSLVCFFILCFCGSFVFLNVFCLVLFLFFERERERMQSWMSSKVGKS